ncbi:MAG: prohibitin family protein [Candidatus Falkowbacteria bacterium]
MLDAKYTKYLWFVLLGFFLYIFSKQLFFMAVMYLLIFRLAPWLKSLKLNKLKYAKVINENNMPNFDASNPLGFLAGKFKKTIVIVIVVLLAMMSVRVIQAGEVGVISLFGSVSERVLKSGLNVVIPFSVVHRLPTRTTEYTMSSAATEGKKVGDDSINTMTKEGLNVGMDITVLYRANEQTAVAIFKTIGADYEEKIIRPTVRSAIREVVAMYDAKEVYSSKRTEVNEKVLEAIKAQVEPRGFIIENVLLRDVKLPDNLTKSIQEKLQAEQEAQKYDFILAKEKKEAERKIIEAAGQRDAQKIINESLTTNYLYYQYIKELKDRPGTIYIPVSSTTGMPVFKGIQ